MAPHDPKLFPRIRLHYHTTAGTHTMTVHVSGVTDNASGLAAANSIANGFKTLLRQTTEGFDSADLILSGTNVANQITGFTPITGGVTGQPNPAGPSVYEVSFIGRTFGGVRARCFLFTTQYQGEANWRIERGEQTVIVDPVLNYLQNLSTPIVAPDGNIPIWKNYCNLTVNRYYLRRARRLAG